MHAFEFRGGFGVEFSEFGNMAIALWALNATGRFSVTERFDFFAVIWRAVHGRVVQRKVFTTPLLTEAKSVRNTSSLPKRNHVAKEAVSAAWQIKTRQRSERIMQSKRFSKDEAAALRKNHVVGLGTTWKVRHQNRLARSQCPSDTPLCYHDPYVRAVGQWR